MKKPFLIASDFYCDFELILAESKEAAENYIRIGISGADISQADVVVVCSSDDTTKEEIYQHYIFETLFLSEYE